MQYIKLRDTIELSKCRARTSTPTNQPSNCEIDMNEFKFAIPSETEMEQSRKRGHRMDADCMHCGFEPPIEERADGFCDVDKSIRRSTLLHGVEARRGTDELTSPERYSSYLIVDQAAQRFFELVAIAEGHLRGRFTETEMTTILNSTCGPIWYWDQFTSVASMVADDLNVEDFEAMPEGHPVRALLEKLAKLSSLENAALVDICERVWRGHQNPLL
jgi:hypothetical protein